MKKLLLNVYNTQDPEIPGLVEEQIDIDPNDIDFMYAYNKGPTEIDKVGVFSQSLPPVSVKTAFDETTRKAGMTTLKPENNDDGLCQAVNLRSATFKPLLPQEWLDEDKQSRIMWPSGNALTVNETPEELEAIKAEQLKTLNL